MSSPPHIPARLSAYKDDSRPNAGSESSAQPPRIVGVDGIQAAHNGCEQALANDVSSRFGRRLRELRQLNSMTQSDMARKFGIDRSYISDVERGRKSISLPILEVIALGLRISLSDLFRDI
jgi:DNA-binding XRE family transcriptional regulator